MADESLRTPAAVRDQIAAALDEMERRLHGLLDSKGRVAEETHALRKLGKSIRGGLNLFGLPKSAVRAIRAIGRLLGGPRDAVSRRTTWQRLALAEGPHAEEFSVAAIGALLDQHARSAARRPPPQTISWAEVRLRHCRAALSAIPEETLSHRAEKGLRKLRKQIRTSLRAIITDHGEHQFHDLRKAIKAWLGALHHLGQTPDERIVQFTDLLGDVNDLHVFATWLDSHGFVRALAPISWRAVDEKLGNLKKDLLRTAPSLRQIISSS
jgi:hypothetical protein